VSFAESSWAIKGTARNSRRINESIDFPGNIISLF